MSQLVSLWDDLVLGLKIGSRVNKYEAPAPIPSCGNDRVEKPEWPIDQALR